MFKTIYENEGVSIHESSVCAVRTWRRSGRPLVVLARRGTSQLIAKYRPEAAIVVGVVPLDKREALEFKGKGLGAAREAELASRGLYPMVCDPADSTDDLIVQSMVWAARAALRGQGRRRAPRAETQALVMKILSCPSKSVKL